MYILRDEKFRGTTLITAKKAVTLQDSNKSSAMITGQTVAAYCAFQLLCSGARISIRPYRPHSNGGSLKRCLNEMFSLNAFEYKD